MTLVLPDLPAYFTHGRSFRDTGTTIIGDPYDHILTVSVESVGELWLPSGRIVVSDPAFLGDAEMVPLAAELGAGCHQVSVSRVTTTYVADPHISWDDVAAARIVVREEPTVAWEPARPGDPEEEHGPGEGSVIYGYGVDSGRSCFVDPEVNRALAEDDAARERMSEAALSWGTEPSVLADPDSGHQAAGFPSGAGDGVYPTWLGRDAEGRVTCVVTTFRHDIR
ncbi:DUF4241 domain-containing protein [Streptomyces sp. NA04227]|uniref:DUF4241 domain-containing protein n=1 Tax=Streptomyces sp. NA04227 TaxID=2742136 RepID=UPI001590AF1D|nr:DUF4241 domain-containing protein [Streptomyces sp. NA04227]QKW08792.1 DUF4241 domain-containing protein [Streptomyces sp. NA04227]